jgi:pimeloyl-ACP methyl ester carboxylesterase
MTLARRRIGEMVSVDVDGFAGRMHVRDDGPADGPALVLVHGFSGSLHWYDRVVPLLADTFRLVRVDLIGHGATGGPAVDAPVQARAVAQVLEILDVDDATAVGHSFGADVAVDLAETSDRISRLVIVCQAPDYSDATLPRGKELMTVPLLDGLLHRTGKGLAIGLNAIIGRTRRDPADRELARQAVLDFRALNTGMFRIILVDRRKRMSFRPLDDQLRDAGKPTLAVLGGRDHFYGTRAEGRYREAGARVEILPESGHSPLVEYPQDIAALIRAFALDA